MPPRQMIVSPDEAAVCAFSIVRHGDDSEPEFESLPLGEMYQVVAITDEAVMSPAATKALPSSCFIDLRPVPLASPNAIEFTQENTPGRFAVSIFICFLFVGLLRPRFLCTAKRELRATRDAP